MIRDTNEFIDISVHLSSATCNSTSSNLLKHKAYGQHGRAKTRLTDKTANWEGAADRPRDDMRLAFIVRASLLLHSLEFYGIVYA